MYLFMVELSTHHIRQSGDVTPYNSGRCRTAHTWINDTGRRKILDTHAVPVKVAVDVPADVDVNVRVDVDRLIDDSENVIREVVKTVLAH